MRSKKLQGYEYTNIRVYESVKLGISENVVSQRYLVGYGLRSYEVRIYESKMIRVSEYDTTKIRIYEVRSLRMMNVI